MYNGSSKIIFLFLLFFLSFFLFCLPQNVFASTPSVIVRDATAYSARFLSQSEPDPITIVAGESKIVKIKFKNIGKATWDSGGRYISAYTMEPRNRSSVFADNTWTSSQQTAKIAGKISPGGTGELTISLRAPAKVGDYVEKFYLAAENYSWIRGGYFFLKIKVVEGKKNISGGAADIPERSVVVASTTVSQYQARRIAVKTRKVSLKGGELVNLLVHFQNNGKTKWSGFEMRSNSTTDLPVGESAVFANSDWRSQSVVLRTQENIDPKGIAKIAFSMRAPAKAGEYTARFTLFTDGEEIAGAVYDVSVRVTEDAVAGYVTPTFLPEVVNQIPELGVGVPSMGIVENIRFEEEPIIRVGITKSEGTVKIIPTNDDYRIFAGTVEKGILPKGHRADLKYVDGVYTFKGNGIIFSGPDFLRLVPVNNPRAIFRVTNLQRYVKWKGPKNFNEYRGVAELRVTNDNRALYLINELGIEDYVAGIAETSNASPIEYIKALLTAARTYAYYTKEHTSKHDVRNFDVVANTGDQLFLGYVSEELMPRVVKAAEDTRGLMITHDNNIVTTPYYANSDGKTKSWKSVWGGSERPWLVPVIAKYDNGQPLRGHGVGMSARDAAYRADRDGESFVQLIQYYYTGTEVQKVFN